MWLRLMCTVPPPCRYGRPAAVRPNSTSCGRTRATAATACFSTSRDAANRVRAAGCRSLRYRSQSRPSIRRSHGLSASGGCQSSVRACSSAVACPARSARSRLQSPAGPGALSGSGKARGAGAPAWAVTVIEALQGELEIAEHVGREGAVDHPVVEGESETHHGCRHDAPRPHHGPVGDLTGAQGHRGAARGVEAVHGTVPERADGDGAEDGGPLAYVAQRRGEGGAARSSGSLPSARTPRNSGSRAASSPR